VTDTQLPCIQGSPLLLLFEPSESDRAMQIGRSRFRMIRVTDTSGIYLMQDKLDFALAVLSDLVGCVALRASAETVRRNWPKARILILGRVPDQFEDHLYDDSIVHASDGRALLATLDRLANDPWPSDCTRSLMHLTGST
jgi:hypothetical protein